MIKTLSNLRLLFRYSNVYRLSNMIITNMIIITGTSLTSKANIKSIKTEKIEELLSSTSY